MEFPAAFIGLSIVLAIIGFQIFRWVRQKKKDKPILEKIEEYRKTGQALMHEQEVPLTGEEAARIKSAQGWMTFVMASVMILILVGVACFLIYAIELNNYLVLTGFFILAGAWIYWILGSNAKQKRDIETDSKTIIRGIITKKYAGGDDTTTYYIVIDKTELIVKKAVYKKYRLGDAVEFHVFKPYQWYVLYQAKLEGAGLTDLQNKI